MKTAQHSSSTGIGARRGDPTGHVRMSVAERREFRRDSVALRAALKINSESFSAEILDISAGGAQLRCSVVPRAGIEILLEMDGLGVLPARVIRRLPKTIAVEFTIPETQRADFAEKLDMLLKAHA